MTPIQWMMCIVVGLNVVLLAYGLWRMMRQPSPLRVLEIPTRTMDQWTCEHCWRSWVLTFDGVTGTLETPHTLREMVNHKCKGEKS